MMNQVSTMTTKVAVTIAKDAFSDNDVIHLGRSVEEGECKLTVISWLVKVREESALLQVFKGLYKMLQERLPDYDVWLLVGTSAWQPDTRITRYRRLWGALKLRGLEVLCGNDFKEFVVEGGSGIKFYGAAALTLSSASSVINIILNERCSYFACFPKGCDVDRLLKGGWSGEVVSDLSFICRVASSNGFVLKSVGEFDDVEWGFFYLGPLEIALKIRDDEFEIES